MAKFQAQENYESRRPAWRTFLKDNQVSVALYKHIPSLLDQWVPGLRLTFDNSGESYTDGKHINLSISTNMLAPKYGPKEWGLLMRALCAHECQHINSSDFKDIGYLRDWYGEYMHTNHGINKAIGSNLAAEFHNCVEDGRIEQICANHHPGLRIAFQYMNVEDFSGAVFTKKIGSPQEEYIDFRNQVLCYSKLGVNISGMKHRRGTRFYKEFYEIRDLIDQGVNGYSSADCRDAVQAILTKLAPYFADLLRADSSLPDMLENLVVNSSGGSNETSFNDGDGESNVRSGKGGKPGKGKPKPGKGGGSSGDKVDDKNGGSGDGGKGDKKDGGKSEASGDGKPGSDSDEKDGVPKGKSGSGSDGGQPDGSSDDSSSGDDKGKSSDKRSSAGQPGRGKGMSTDETHGTDISALDEDSEMDTDFDGEDEEAEEFDLDEKELDLADLPYSEQELIEEMRDATSVAASPKPPKAGPRNELTKKEANELKKAYDDKGDHYTKFVENFPKVSPAPLSSDMMIKANRLHKSLEMILRGKRADQRNQRKGTLDTRSLYKVGTNSQNIFYKKGKPMLADCAVFELIDNSGSMSGAKFKFARLTAGALEIALHGFAKLKISLFNTNYPQTIHNTVKDFEDPEFHGKSIAAGSLKNSSINAGGGNKDGYSIRVATAELLKRPEKMKILLILSDGVPTDYKGGIPEGIKDVKAAVAEAKKKGIIVVTFLIGSAREVESNKSQHINMYGRSLLSCAPEQMLDQFVKLFKTLIKNS